MTKDEALRLALEALKKSKDALAEELAAWDIDPPLHHVLEAHDACEPAIKACEEALAQPEPEPKFWEMPDGKIVDKWALQFYRGDIGTPLYTHPKEWVDLTDDEIIDVIHPLVMADMPDEATDYKISRAILKAAKEKNT